MSKLIHLALLALLALCVALPLVSAHQGAEDENQIIAQQMDQWMESAEDSAADVNMMEVESETESESELTADIAAEAEAEAESEVDATIMAEMQALSEMQSELEAVTEADLSQMSEQKRFKLKKLAKKISNKIKGAVKKAGRKVKAAVKKAGKKIKKAVKKVVKRIMCWWKGGKKYCGGSRPAAASTKPGRSSVRPSRGTTGGVKPSRATGYVKPNKGALGGVKPSKGAIGGVKPLPAVKPTMSVEQLNAKWETESAKKIATLTAPKIEYYHEIQEIDGKEVDITARAIIDNPERAAYRQRVKDDIQYAKTVSSAASLKKTTDAFTPLKKAKKL